MVAARRPGPPAAAGPSPWPGAEPAVRFLPAAGPRTATGRPVDAGGLAELLARVHCELPGTPLLVTGNGAARDDHADPSGRVHDPGRIAYLAGHVAAVHRAIAAGIDVRGYFVRSLLDDFEWAYGCSRRFGIVHVDFASGRRTPRDSARWYAARVAANRARPDPGPRPPRRRRTPGARTGVAGQNGRGGRAGQGGQNGRGGQQSR